MFYFTGTRKPNFRSTRKIDYNLYWKERGFSILKKLKEREVIISKLIDGGNVLDIGCGNSRLPIVLKEKGCNVLVADVSDEVLKGYREYGINSVTLDLEKLQSIDLPSFDYIILSEVLEHITNPEEVLSFLKRKTKYFYITIPNSAFYRFRFHLMFSGRFFTQWVHHPSEHVRFWSHKDFLDWLSALDFEIDFTEASNGLSIFGFDLFKFWPNLFGHQIVYKVHAK